MDLSEFHAVFFEESFELLSEMESGLLELDPGSPNDETINTIFRAAHSIKGGAGTFGFEEIAHLTHILETLLDEVRSGERVVTLDLVNLLLRSGDCLQEMLVATKSGAALDTDKTNEVQGELSKMLLEGKDNDSGESSDADDQVHDNAAFKWHVSFVPNPTFFEGGNDPLRIFRELESLGKLQVRVDLSALPDSLHCDPRFCYLCWELEISGPDNEREVKEAFDWVDEHCELTIEKVDVENKDVQPTETAPEDSSVDAQTKTVPDPEPDNEKEQVKAVENVAPEKTSEPVSKIEDAPKKAAKSKTDGTESASIRVSIDKVDALINMVGELVITQSMLSQFSEELDMSNLDKLKDGLAMLERNTRELQENVMQIRMLPISFAFSRFPRLVRDLSGKLGKKIELKMSGEQTELDKTVMEKIGDPLVHLVRNALDHGIETPDIRAAAGKPESGVLHLNAFHQGGNILIEISDDGAGLNSKKILEKARDRNLVGPDENLSKEQIHELMFAPGFSTADAVSDLSGRGVGMDVVRRNIKSLGGDVEVVSEEGVGSTFRIRLPLTLAIVDGQLVRVGSQIYIMPLISIVESLQLSKMQCNTFLGKGELCMLRDEYIPIIRLSEIFNIQENKDDEDNGLLVVVEAEGKKIGLYVDDLLSQQQVVIKSLETNYMKVKGVSGATILGDGVVAMILDISGLMELTKAKSGPKIPETDDVIIANVA